MKGLEIPRREVPEYDSLMHVIISDMLIHFLWDSLT